MKFFDQFVAAVKRLNPKAEISAEATEAELLDALQAVSTPAEMTGQMEDIVSRLGVLESASVDLTSAIQASVDTQLEAITAQLSNIPSDYAALALEATADARGTLKTEILEAVAVSKVGIKKDSQPAPAPAASTKKAEKKEGDEDSMQINADDLFKRSSVVNGLPL